MKIHIGTKIKTYRYQQMYFSLFLAWCSLLPFKKTNLKKKIFSRLSINWYTLDQKKNQLIYIFFAYYTLKTQHWIYLKEYLKFFYTFFRLLQKLFIAKLYLYKGIWKSFLNCCTLIYFHLIQLFFKGVK